MIGLEALIRWRHPEMGLLPPLQFIPIAEEVGLIEQIGEWVVRSACRQHEAWRQQGLLHGPVSINISASQFIKPGFADAIAQILRETGVPSGQLELDLKESLLMHDPADSMRVLDELKRTGVGLSIDDFGTGFSNLGFLKRFPVDRIKLDPSFVREVLSHPDDLAVTDAVITMAHKLGMKVAVEGVESGSQLALLAEHGCDEMQGDYFSPALPVDLCTALLQERRELPEDKRRRQSAGRTLLLIAGGAAPILLPEGASCRLIQASNAVTAFDILASEEVSVVVCEQDMHGMSGVEFLGRISRMYPRTVRIMCSDNSDAALVEDAVNVGNVFRFVRKPRSGEELAATLEAAFAHHESGAARH
ncbi:hypothetical protein AYR66_20775 [Noviherbaspirillum denitrificans]|uniref:EAL domain-containing protein n=1 Tax=Noviherbaspirillum denitrificans TaxID=1968433 RepID=A0A254TG04_9BURK|nr:hypothetical protein AYR66_20775 [Noviherbaspirillum denitrificans]